MDNESSHTGDRDEQVQEVRTQPQRLHRVQRWACQRHLRQADVQQVQQHRSRLQHPRWTLEVGPIDGVGRWLRVRNPLDRSFRAVFLRSLPDVGGAHVGDRAWRADLS